MSFSSDETEDVREEAALAETNWEFWRRNAAAKLRVAGEKAAAAGSAVERTLVEKLKIGEKAAATTGEYVKVVTFGFLGCGTLLKFWLTGPPSFPKRMPTIIPMNYGASTASPSTDHLSIQSPEDLRRKAQEKLGMDTENKYNFGITGQAGAGKSSIINALCGRKDTDKGTMD